MIIVNEKVFFFFPQMQLKLVISGPQINQKGDYTGGHPSSNLMSPLKAKQLVAERKIRFAAQRFYVLLLVLQTEGDTRKSLEKSLEAEDSP